MKTIVLTKTVNGNLQCTALCIEADYEKLESEHQIYDRMHESIFRTLYPVKYAKYVESNLMDCICIWIEQFYNGKKDFHMNDHIIFTESYLITTKCDAINLMLYVGCSAIEISKFVLYLSAKLHNTSIDIEVNETTLFSDICSN